MSKEIKRYLAEIHSPSLNRENPELLRVILSEDRTQIDFGYAASSIYIKGGWIRISADTFIQIKGSEKRYKLIEAKNISIAPALVEFESKSDWCVFSLFFEPIPIKDCIIDMIEEVNPTPNDFNYYNIEVTTLNKTQIILT